MPDNVVHRGYPEREGRMGKHLRNEKQHRQVYLQKGEEKGESSEVYRVFHVFQRTLTRNLRERRSPPLCF